MNIILLSLLSSILGYAFSWEVENTLSNERESLLIPFGNNKKNSLNKNVKSGKGKSKLLVCYYGTWSVYRPGLGKFNVEDIDPFLCTHIIYAFAGLGHDNRIKPLDPWNDLKENYGKGGYERFNALKKINPKLKTLIGVGGWNEGSIKYSNMVSDSASRKKFVLSAVEFLQKYGFDGLDMDWEYPAIRGGNPKDKENFVSLLQDLKNAFAHKGFLLTTAVSAGKWNIDPAYDIPRISQLLDFINVMCYDYHGSWEDRTGLNTPLYARPNEPEKDLTSNVNFSINYWILKGAPPEKLVLGTATYGRSFTLSKETDNGIRAYAPQKGMAGPYTREAGSLGYNEICEAQTREQWNIVRDPYYLVPYTYKGRQWVGYDDIESIKLKVRFAKFYNLAGVMVWSLETDDFHGKCHGQKSPLINTIKDELLSPDNTLPTPKSSIENEYSTSPSSSKDWQWTQKSSTSPSTEKTWDWSQKSTTTLSSSTNSTYTKSTATLTTRNWQWIGSSSKTVSTIASPSTMGAEGAENSSSSTSSTEITSTTKMDDAITCKVSGMFRDPKNCRKFYRCVDTGVEGKFHIFEYYCPTGTVFDEVVRICLWPLSVPECSKYYLTEEF